MNKILSLSERGYIQELSNRMLTLEARISTLMKRPLTDYDEESGMLVCHAAGKLLWAMAWMDRDLLEALA